MKNTQKKPSLVNFGKGWGIILFAFFSCWFYAGMVNDTSANIVIPALSVKTGIPLGTLLSLVSIAALVGAAFMFLMGYVNKRIGARYTAAICLVILAIGYVGLGNATNITEYFIAQCFLQCGGPSAVFISSASLIAKWFPKKTGLAMGYTTMGMNFSSMLFIPLVAALVAKYGVAGGVVIPGIICVVFALICIIFVRNDPQDRGVNPDNVSDEVYEAEYYESNKSEDDNFKISAFLNKPLFWVVIVSSCLFQFVNVIVITQLVNRGLEYGFSVPKAITMVSICAIVGVAGSWLIGFLDHKIGTKKAMLVLSVWTAITCALSLSDNPALITVFYIMFGFALGGGNNFMSSLPINVFGRHLFSKLNIIICPLSVAITSFGVMVNGVSLTTTGNLDAAYIVAIVTMVVQVILVCTVKAHKFDPDYMSKEEAAQFMASIQKTELPPVKLAIN